MIQLGADAGGCGRPDERSGIGVVLVEVTVDGGLEVDDRAEGAALEALRVSAERKISTASSGSPRWA
jgi:hypothetical protein